MAATDVTPPRAGTPPDDPAWEQYWIDLRARTGGDADKVDESFEIATDAQARTQAELTGQRPAISRILNELDALKQKVADLERSQQVRRLDLRDEIQFENSSLNGEDLDTVLSGSTADAGIGHVAEADSADLRTYYFNPAFINYNYNRGKVYWDESEFALMLHTDGVGNRIQLGRQVAYRVVNTNGSTINKGQVVYAKFPTAGIIQVSEATASLDDRLNNRVLGLAAEDIDNYQIGYIVAFGEILFDTGANTDSDGNALDNRDNEIFLSEQTTGGHTIYPPERRVKLGNIIRIDSTSHKIVVNVQNEDRLMYNAVSFRAVGENTGLLDLEPARYNSGTGNGLCWNDFNVEYIEKQGGTGVYRVHLHERAHGGYLADSGGGNYNFEVNNIWNIEQMVPMFNVYTTGGTTPILSARITNVHTYFRYFDFTVYKHTTAGALGGDNVLVAYNLTADDYVNFIGQLQPQWYTYNTPT